MIQTILLPVTADPPPAIAARRAAALAQRTGARVVLLHVVSPETLPLDFDRLQQALAPLLEGVAVTPLLRRGPPAREILAAAREERADVILMTRHGRWTSSSELGFPRFLLHSVLCRVMLAAPCAVWVEPQAGGPADITHVLCAVGSLFLDRDTITMAQGLAGITGAELVLFRNAVSAAIAIPGQSQRAGEWQREVLAVTQADLEGLRDGMGVPAQARAGVGPMADALLQETGIDLIVVRRTSRDWGKDETLLPLVRGTCVPVVIVPGEIAAVPPVRRRAPSGFERLAQRALLVVAMLLGVWLMRSAFTVVRHPDMCATHAYGCAFEEGWKRTTGARPKEPPPLVTPEKPLRAIIPPAAPSQ